MTAPRTCHGRALGVALGAAALAVQLVGTACAGLEDPLAASLDAGAASDGGAAVFVDGAPRADSAVPPGAREADFGAAACYDFNDDDEDGQTDCADDDCATTPVCCVGSARAGCCQGLLDQRLDFAACSGTGAAALLACAPGAIAFGSPAPELRDEGLSPLGSESMESGLVLPGSLDARAAQLTLSATLSAGEACSGCVEALGFGLTSATRFDVDPELDVGILVSSTSGDVRLVVGGIIQARRSLDEIEVATGVAARGPIEYRLTTTLAGSVTVSVVQPGGAVATVLSGTFVPVRGRLMIVGRSTNRASGSPPAPVMSDVRVQTAVCDVPSALTRSATGVLPDSVDRWWQPVERLSAPSIAQYVDGTDTITRMAFVRGGRIHIAAGTMDGRGFRALLEPGVPGNAAVLPEDVMAVAGETITELDDPSLIDRGDRFELFFTVRRADGSSFIANIMGGEAHDTTFNGAITRLLEPDATATFAYDGISVAQVDVGGTRDIAVVRRVPVDGPSEILLYTLDALRSARDGGAAADAEFTMIAAADGSGGQSDRAVHRARSADPLAFDHDEVAAPTLVVHRGVARIYYAGRRGTRWAIGTMVSQDLVYWQAAEDGRATLAAAGAGFDALSVTDPAVLVTGGTLRVFYAGGDGIRSSIGLADQPVSAM